MKTLPDFLHLYFDDDGPGDAGVGGGDPGNDPGSGAGGDGSTDGEKTFTKEELDAAVEAAVKARLARERKKSEAEAKRKSEAERLSNMNDQDRSRQENEALRRKVEELERAQLRSEMASVARGILQSEKVSVPDILVDTLIADDADETNERVKAFCKTFKAAVQAQVKEQLAHKEKTGGSSGGITKEDIMKEKNPQKRQELIRKNMALFRHDSK